ncbi:MAG: 4-(cytidine 5'-diphospho)-2-C-methyl-D-erythritol kinase [Marmoricola sp.]
MSGPEAVTVRAAAKINLQLGVGPLREDGYHPLATVYQAIGIYDDVTVTEADHWELRVAAHQRIDVSEVPTGPGNIALRAGRLLADHHGTTRAAAIAIDKGIPVAGGLAGGSADAAATLLALDRLWDLRTPDDVLLGLAGRLGSDVPFALVGGSARGDGRGELVQRVPDHGGWWWVVVESDIGLSTPLVYAAFDRLHGSDVPSPGVSRDLLDALEAGDARALAGALSNDLQRAALTLRPDLVTVLDLGAGAGALAGIVSGSGPTCVFLCPDADVAHRVGADFDAVGFTRVQVAPGPVAGAHEVTYE